MLRLRLHYPQRPLDTPRVALWGLGIHELMRRTTVRRPQGIGCHLFLYFYDPVRNRTPRGWEDYAAGTFVVFAPRHAHDFGSLEQRWDHSWLLVGGRQIGHFLRENAVPVNRPVRAPLAPALEKAILEIHEEVAAQGWPREDYVRNLLQNLAIDIGRKLAGRETAVPEAYLEARRYIQANYTQRLSLAQLARRAHVSVPRFATRFRKFFGVPPIEYLLRLRIERACFLLRDVNLNVGQVAQEIGCENIHYFSRLFRQRLGMPPTAFRKRMEESAEFEKL